jgi:hypothetical protein
MTGLNHRTFVRANDPIHFTARYDAWDPFIIYLVDPKRPSTPGPVGPDPHRLPASHPKHYPRPPLNALPLFGCAQPLYYNQPVVLQCLSSGIVSPVLIIRKVGNGTSAMGGGSIYDGPLPEPALPCHSPLRRLIAPGEELGERVSQLHKVAFEIMENPKSAYDVGATSKGFEGPSRFFSCVGESVGRPSSHPALLAYPQTSPPSTFQGSTMR